MFNFFEKKDAQIQIDVAKEVEWDPRVSSTGITVSVRDGIVTLRGSVPHYFEKSNAVDAAQRVGGVRAVADEIEVNIMGSYNRGDEEIAEAAVSALAWNYLVPKSVKVEVEKGRITLSGQTDWDYQRTAAETAVSRLLGVTGVDNRIAIKTKLVPADIRDRIEKAIKRSAKNEARKIHVVTQGTKVILSGSVHSLSESEVATAAAWMAPGILAVENDLKIE